MAHLSSAFRFRPAFINRTVVISRRWSHIDLKGMYPPLVTPFNNDESVAYDKLQQNLNKLNKIPLRGYLIHGTNGEYPSLVSDEKVEMVKFVRNLVPKDRLLLVGSGCQSTQATIQLTELMAKAGADAAAVVTPSYYKNCLTTESLVKHYQQVADASPIPIILYSVPSSTGIDLPVEAIVRLSTHPNIIGLKDSGGDVSKLGAILSQVPLNSFQVLAGGASYLLPSYSIGCVGGICALANVLGNELCQLTQMGEARKDLDKAAELQRRLILPNLAVTKMYGVPGLKFAMELFGYYGGLPRRPLLPVTDSEKKVVTEIFRLQGFI